MDYAKIWTDQQVGEQVANANDAANAWRRRTVMEAQARNTDAHGSAGWLTTEEAAAAGLVGNLTITLGKVPPAWIGYDGEPHLMTIAPTGSGKGVGVVLPNQFYPGSMLAVDPKGSLPAMAARLRRGLGQKVYTLDPWGISGEPQACLNPFDILDPDDEDLADDAQLLAEMLVIGETGKNKFFSDNARTFVRALILHIVTSAPKDHWNVSTLLDLAYRSGADFDYLLQNMKGNQGAFGQVRRLANEILGCPEETLGNIHKTVTRSLDFLQSPRMQKVLSRSDFSFQDLKRSRITVYLVLPEDRIESYSRWLRLMIGLAILECGRVRQTVKPQVLFLLDEFTALGRMEVVENAVGLMRGYGIRFWPIFQDFPRFKSLYQDAAGTFIANSGVLQVFNVNDIETAKMVSERLGKETRNVTDTSTRPHDVNTMQMIGRDLLMPDEVLRLPEDVQLLMYAGLKPFLTKKLRFYEEPTMKNRFDPDPMRN